MVATGRAASTDAGLVGLWRFDDPTDLTRADLGQPLILVGSHLTISGFDAQDSAARIGLGS